MARAANIPGQAGAAPETARLVGWGQQRKPPPHTSRDLAPPGTPGQSLSAQHGPRCWAVNQSPVLSSAWVLPRTLWPRPGPEAG